jgi:hypothetical protein
VSASAKMLAARGSNRIPEDWERELIDGQLWLATRLFAHDEETLSEVCQWILDAWEQSAKAGGG